MLAVCIALPLGVPAPVLATTAPSDFVDGKSASKRHLGSGALPDVTVKAGALVDGDGRVLWARYPDTRRPMASITKIMTAVVALEHSSLDEKVTIPRASGAVGESTAFLRPGESLPMRDVLEALLVKSGNDAAVAIAQHVGGTEAQFVEMMNAKARELGLSNTHFANPHGLDAPGHYTTADDLAVLARYAMTKPAFRDIVKLKTVSIGTGKTTRHLLSTDALLGTYQGAMGVKTGFTNGAGYSVVSAAERDGVTLYAIVLGTASEIQRFRDAKALLDWGFAHYRPMRVETGGAVLAEARVSDYLDVSIPVAVSKDVTVPVLDLDGPIKRSISVADVKAPVAKGQTLGVATFKQGGKVIATVPLVSTQDVKRPNPFLAAWIAVVRAWQAVTGG
jgi:D-alanyl-D-alanine carboxypeptidase (penicillin-binding protein 5/6)